MSSQHHRWKAPGITWQVGSLILFGASIASAQTPPEPLPSTPSPPGVAPAATSREVELEARVRQLESLVNRLSRQVDTIAVPPAVPAAGPPVAPGPAAPGAGSSSSDSGGPSSNPTGSSGLSGLGAPAGSQPESPESPLANMPAGPINKPGKVKFGPG